MSTDPALLRRIDSLERELEQLSRDVDTNDMRAGTVSPKYQVRLAKTVTSKPEIDDPDNPGTMISDYPKTGNTFEIVFVDADYTEAEGDQSPTTTDRQKTEQPLPGQPPLRFSWVHNLSGGYLAAGTVLAVARHNGKWWTWGAPSATMVFGTIADEDGTSGGSFKGANIDPINGTFAGTKIDVVGNPFTFNGDQGGLFLALLHRDFWKSVQLACPAQVAAALASAFLDPLEIPNTEPPSLGTTAAAAAATASYAAANST